MSNDLVIKDLYARIGDKEILRGVNLTVRQGTIHAIMGPNGSGKSTLSYIIAGHPAYEVTGGEIWYKGHNLLELEPDERSRLGVFLAFQYPVAVPGVTVANFFARQSTRTALKREKTRKRRLFRQPSSANCCAKG